MSKETVTLDGEAVARVLGQWACQTLGSGGYRVELVTDRSGFKEAILTRTFPLDGSNEPARTPQK